METDLITLNDFCASHQIEVSFIQTLEEHGLVQTVIVDQSLCIPSDELPQLERIVRLHRELNINPEGIDVINRLLEQMKSMKQEITALRNRLEFYSNDE